MATASYGTTNPRGLEPWPIESTLATAAYAGDKSQLQSELNSYQMQRQAAGNVYGQDLDAQHAFAYQQLQQQMREQYLKAIPEFAKSNTLGILASGADAGQAFAGADPSVIADAIAQARAAQNAKNFAEGGKGAEGYSNAGITVGDSNVLPGLAGVPITQGENARIAAERIRAGAILGAAGIKAAASGGGGLGISFAGAPDPRLGGASPNIVIPKKMTYEQGVKLATDQGLIRPPIQPPPPDAQPGTPAAQPSTTPPNATGLQPKGATSASAPAQAPIQITNDVKNKVRAAVEVMPITDANRTKMADVKAGYVGGQPNVIMTPKGPAIIGKSKQPYYSSDF